MGEILSADDVVQLAKIVQGVRSGARIRMAEHDGVTFTGVLRHFTNSGGDAAHMSDDVDIRDAWVRVSATWEHWFPVSSLLDGLRNMTVVID